MISTIYHATPPTGYGGIERVVSLLTEQLIREGHDVTLFATPGSHCSARTVEIPAYDPARAPSGVRKGKDILSEEPLYETMSAFFKNHPVDVIHDWSFQNLFVLRHPERFPFVISTCIPPAAGYQRPRLVACSKAHAQLCGGTTRSVHYGLDLKNWAFSYAKKKHLIHISKITPYKGQHLAIQSARKAGQELFLAGNIEERWYYWTKIKPRLWFTPMVKYIGELQGTNTHLKEAAALVQTPLWFDAFPLVILEALASATPVIAFPQGGIPEQIIEGKTGFLCRNTDDLANAMKHIGDLKPQDCRAYAEEYFSVKRMATDYTKLYEAVCNGETW
jgi:glycosyltransferase involved in cell wall biosynthesis